MKDSKNNMVTTYSHSEAEKLASKGYTVVINKTGKKVVAKKAKKTKK